MKTARMNVIGMAVLMMAASAQAAGNPGGLPSPGSYRIDSETTRTNQIGPNETVVVHRVDGATGKITILSKKPGDPGNGMTQTTDGPVPALRCVPAGSGKPFAAAKSCTGEKRSVGSTTATMSGACNGLAFDHRWTRIDERTWDHVMRVKGVSAVAGAPSNGGVGFVLPPPARLAKMPSDEAQVKAMVEMRAMLETVARGNDPQMAAAARQALTQYGGTGSEAITGSGSDHLVKERWTRVAEDCPAAR